MYEKLLSVLVLTLVLSTAAAAQSLVGDEVDKASDEIKENAAELLLETSQMIANLRSPDNRLSATVKAADWMWETDETRARQMFQSAMQLIRQDIARTDMELNRLGTLAANEWASAGSARNLRTRFNKIFAVRVALVNALADHDAEWAANFVRETGSVVTNAELVRRFAQSDKTLLSRIEKKAVANDIDKIFELGREKLENGISFDTGSTLRQIYTRDAEKGAKFGAEVFEKLKSSSRNVNPWVLSGLLGYGASVRDAAAKNGKIKKTPFSEQQMREIARMMADRIVDPQNRARRLPSRTQSLLEKYAPEKAAQVSRVLAERNTSRNGQNADGRRNSENINSITRKMNQARNDVQQNINRSIENLNDENLSAAERESVIEEARKKILAVGSDAFRASNLIRLANRAAAAGEREIAAGLLAEAERLIVQPPKNRTDFVTSRNLAAAYAAIDPDRSFAMLENMVFRLNDVVEGYSKFGEFSGNSRIVENGELLIGNYSRQFSSFFVLPSATLFRLAEADFARLKNLADKFARPELRVEVRLQLAGALLKGNQTNSSVRPTTRTSVR